MNQPLNVVRQFDPAPVTTLLCDADDNLFPSERPAFAASVEVINRFLARLGVHRPVYRGGAAQEGRREELSQHRSRPRVQCGLPMEQALAVGRPAAVVASDADAAGQALNADELEQWVRQEREQVTAHLAATLCQIRRCSNHCETSRRSMH